MGAGVPCVDSTAWSNEALGDAGRSFLPSQCFLRERAAAAEDVVYCECAPAWSSDLLQAALPGSRLARVMLCASGLSIFKEKEMGVFIVFVHGFYYYLFQFFFIICAWFFYYLRMVFLISYASRQARELIRRLYASQ